MFTGIKDVHDGFFGFFGKNLVINHNTGSLEIPCVYARHSNNSYYAKVMESYPRIVILDTQIKPSNNWRPNEERYVVGYEKSLGSPTFDLAYVGKDPIELLFDYQVSAYFNNLDEKFSFIEWVYGNLRAHGGLLLHKEVVNTSLPNEEVGSMVTYTMQTNEIERTDGIFEYNLLFTLKPLVYLDKVELVPVVGTFNINS